MAFPGTYKISCGGKTIDARLRKSHNEIRDFISTQSSGVYDVDEVLPSDPDSVGNSEYYGEFTRHESGEVTYNERSASGDE
jgi:hypothetical protein